MLEGAAVANVAMVEVEENGECLNYYSLNISKNVPFNCLSWVGRRLLNLQF